MFDDNDNRSHNRIVSEVAASAFSNITDSIIDTHSAIKVLAITVTAELGGFAMFYVAKDKVEESLADDETGVWIYAAIAIFLVGFLTAFAGYRLIANKWRHRNSGILIWIVSIAAGAANIVLFLAFLVLSFR